jgi:hypothetical protein
MSSISNRFYITALEDGTTLHGNLAVEGSLSQAWNGQAAVPDWTVAANQPLIYLTLLSGGTLVAPSNDFKWLYNGVEITNADTRFQKTTKSVTYGSTTLAMPALKIVANLASSSNVDVDLITFEGNYVISGTGISFTATAQIRISTISTGSSLGVINFHNGISDITTKGQVVVAYGMLYNPDGTADNTVTTKWYLNDSSTPTAGTTIQGHTNAYQVAEGQVVDHATIRCEFYKGSTLLYTAYASVDDMQDPEFMYVQYNGNNGNAASLRQGETASFQIWVGTRTDPTPIGGTTNPTYGTIKVKLLDGDGQVITASGLATNIPDAAADGYRTLPMSGGKATITPHYDTVNGVGKKNLTGIILAETSN